MFSYFQDKIGMTHYLFPYGLPGTGKGAMLETAHQLAYRAVLFSSARAASIYRTLGTVEPGQACLLIDEANGLGDNVDLQEVLKTGYKGNGKVPRVLDASSSAHTAPTFFCTYGWKMVAAERLPSEYKAAGFLSRTLMINTIYGKPKRKIDKVVEHNGNARLKKLHDQIVELRNILFAFRLVHHSEEITDVKLNIDGRPEELCAPLIRLFKDTEVENEILGALSEFVIESQNEKADGFDAFLYRTVRDMLDAGKVNRFENSTIWNMLKDILKGQDIPDKAQMMRTARYGDISKARVTQTLKKFGAKSDRDESGDKRVLIFDRERFDKFCAMFDVPKKIEIVPLSDTSDTSDTLWEDNPPNNVHDEGQKTDNDRQNNENSTQESPDNMQNNATENVEKSPDTPRKVSEVSDARTSEPENGKMFSCPYCTTRYSSKELVIRHSINIHPGKPVTDDIGGPI